LNKAQRGDQKQKKAEEERNEMEAFAGRRRWRRWVSAGESLTISTTSSGFCGVLELLLSSRLTAPGGIRLRTSITGRAGAAIIQDSVDTRQAGVTVAEVVNLNDIISSYLQTSDFHELEGGHPTFVSGSSSIRSSSI
jgi:hypothetical protein